MTFAGLAVCLLGAREGSSAFQADVHDINLSVHSVQCTHCYHLQILLFYASLSCTCW